MHKPFDYGATTISAALRRQIDKFPATSRGRLAAFAGRSARIAQLASTHPLLFHALAHGEAAQSDCAEAVRLAIEGRPLHEVANAIGLPPAFRKFPPEACIKRAYPQWWSAGSNVELTRFLPHSPHDAARWLHNVEFARRACDEAFACWIARQRIFMHTPASEQRAIQALAMFAWHSRHRDLRAGSVLPMFWSPKRGFKQALSNVRSWLFRLEFLLYFPASGLEDGWLKPAHGPNGVRFEPLVTPAQILAEADVMHHWADTYAKLLVMNCCRLFSVMRSLEKIATVEVHWCAQFERFKIYQMQGYANGPVPPEIWEATRRWLYSAPQRRPRAPSPIEDIPVLDGLFAEYRQATGNGDARWAKGLTISTLLSDLSLLQTRLEIMRYSTRERRCA